MSALAAASAVEKSTKQYPALLLLVRWVKMRKEKNRRPCLHVPRKLVADHLDVDGLSHVIPNAAHKVLVDPRLKLAHPAAD